MAEVRLAPERVIQAGLAATYNGGLVAAANTYLVRNAGKVILHAKKSGAGACTVTIETPVTIGGLAVAEQTANVPATTGDRFIGPFQPSIFNDGNGDLRITFSEVTGLTVAVLELP